MNASLREVPVNGGEETRVLDSIVGTAYTPARGGVYFLVNRDLRYLSVGTGQSKSILQVPKEPCPGLSVSPDEQWLLYCQIDQSGSELMLVENFH
jgi:hypothetical protein